MSAASNNRLALVTTPTDFSLVQPTPPEITEADAARIARELFGLTATARSLGSHQDRNFLLESGTERVLLKISNASTARAELEAQSAAAEHIAVREPSLRISRTRAGVDGERVRALEVGGQVLHARIIDFLDGEPLSGSAYFAPRSLRAIGELAARVAVALADFEATGADRTHQWDLREAPAVLASLAQYIGSDELRARVTAAAADAQSVIDALAPHLPVQVIHGDLTDDNVVATAASSRIPDGIIDLGDLHRGWAVAEIAITLSSLLHHADGSIESAMIALRAFHAIRPLSRPEAEALWPLVVLRGAVLVASGHHVSATDPGNDYATTNLEHEITILERSTELPLAVATALVLQSLGFETTAPVLTDATPLFTPIPGERVVTLDLAAASPALHTGRWTEPGIESTLAEEALAAGAAIVTTAFAAPRLTRATTRSRTAPLNTPLGITVTVAEGRDIRAPFAGVVTSDGLDGERYRLVLGGARLAVGTAVDAGDIIGSVHGRVHIRFEPIDTPVPAFVTASLAAAWATIAVDPTSLVPEAATSALPGDHRASLLERRDAHLAHAQEYYYDEPPVMVRGWQEHLVDENGRVYLDVLNNVTSVGHSHPRLIEAVTEQWKLLNTNSRFNYPAVVDFAERLAELLPDGLDSVFLVNSGTEAVDLALRIARTWSGRRDILAVREAYHGWSDLSDAVSTSIADNPDALSTRQPWVHTVEAPNSYRGLYRGDEVHRYAEDAVREVEALAAAGTPIGTFIAETFYGNAGGIALPDGYLEAVYAAVRAGGGLVVADEVQVGYGRLGHWFWGFEQQSVVPDIVAVAKAMGNGHPLGAVITTPEIAEHYRREGYFFSSAGGSPVSSVVGTTVLDIIRDEKLQQNAVEVGEYLKQRLLALGDRHPLVGTVHGSGFYLGLEFVRDRETLEPATEETMAICDRLLELGVIVQPTSDRQCVLKIKPPMCLDRASADFFVDALDEVLTTGW